MPEDNSSQELLARIIERLDYLEYSMSRQVARIYALEQKLGLAPPPVKRLPLSEPLPITPSAEPSPELPETPVVENKVEPPPIIVQNIGLKKPDLETLIGGTWFNRIGIIAIVLGVGYFLREAFRRGWIGPHGRVIIGFGFGAGLLIAGERIRARGYRSYSQGLSGGGIAIFYLTVFAAFARYELIGQKPAFLLMSLVTVIAVLLSARYDALAIAILGLIGGFLTPILLSTGQDNQAGLFTYIAFLDAGVLALAYFKQWRVLNYLAFGGTVLIAGVWMLEWYRPQKLWLTIFFFTLFFLIFSLLAIIHNTINKRLTRPLDVGLVFANASIYFATCYGLLEAGYRAYLGLFAVFMSLFFLCLGYFAYKRNGEDRFLILSFIGLATIFLTLAVPIQLNRHWVTMGWAVEGAALSWIGLKTDKRPTRYTGIFVLLIASLHWFAIDFGEFAFNQGNSFTPFFNRRGFSALILIASLAITWRLYKRFGQTVNKKERDGLTAAFVIAANFLALVWLSAEVYDYYSPTAVEGNAERLINSREFALSSLWTIYGLTALYIGVGYGSRVLRLGALALLSLTVYKVVSVDASYFAAAWHRPIFNRTFGAFLLLIAALACAIRLYSRGERIDETERKIALTGLTVTVSLLGIIGLSLEAYGRFESRIRVGNISDGDLRNLILAQRLSLSVIWSVYGAAMLVVGIWRSNRLLRVMALGLLVITIIKVFLFDLASLDAIYRIISFIVLGAILLAVSFLYQKWQSMRAVS